MRENLNKIKKKILMIKIEKKQKIIKRKMWKIRKLKKKRKEKR